MTTALEEHYANEAKRLLADDTFAEALTRIRAKAFADLANADADDRTAIVRLQQKVKLTSEILDELTGMVLSLGDSDGGFDPNKQPE